MKPDMKAYWKTNIGYMVVLLSIWALVSYAFGIVLVNELNVIKVGGFPLGFWFAQQGAIYVFVILIFVYFLLMRRLDRKYDIDE
jgi:putative solute:sodium symporter small subunit